MFQRIYFFLLFGSITILYGDTAFYSLSTCTTSNYEGAMQCKNEIAKKNNLDIYIVKHKDMKYRTYYGSFSTYTDAKNGEKKISSFMKAQKPYIKSLDINGSDILLVEKYQLSKQIALELSPITNIPTKVQPDVIEVNITETQKPVFIIEDKKIEDNLTSSNLNQSQKNDTLDEVVEKERTNKESEDSSFFASIVDELKEMLGLSDNEENIVVEEISDTIGAKTNSVVKDEEPQFRENTIKETIVEIDIPNDHNVSDEKVDTIEKSNKKSIAIEEAYKTIKENIKLAIKQNEPETIITKPIVANENTLNSVAMTKHLISPKELAKYEEFIIKVDSKSNKMIVDGKINQQFVRIKEYIVSTGRKTNNNPKGIGAITAISFSPTWYPTAKTIKHFKSKGINLPSAVPPGHKYNFMGPAKIHLSHIVNGENVYRIHGTLSEKTIGTNESGGCIRMKNKEVLELATLLNKFTTIKKNIQSVKVILE